MYLCFFNSPLHVYFPPAWLLIFQENFPTARLFCPARLMFFKNFPTCTFIPYCTKSIRYTRVRFFKNWGHHIFFWDLLTFNKENPCHCNVVWSYLRAILPHQFWGRNLRNVNAANSSSNIEVTLTSAPATWLTVQRRRAAHTAYLYEAIVSYWSRSTLSSCSWYRSIVVPKAAFLGLLP